jgi:hypothetical protein
MMTDIDSEGERTMATYTIEVTGFSDVLLKRLDERIRKRGGDRSTHIQEFVEKGLAEEEAHTTGKSFDEALASIRQGFAESGMDEDETLALLTEGLKAVRTERGTRQTENVGR